MIKGIKKIIYQTPSPLVTAAMISSVGGISLSFVREEVTTILPLLILLPALNNMVGGYGSILASKFTTWLYRGAVPLRWWKSTRLRGLIKNIYLIALFYSLFIAFLASVLSYYQGFSLTTSVFFRIILLGVVTTTALIGCLSLLVIIIGIFLYQRRLDPDNYLIPFATSIADLGALLAFGGLVHLLF